MFWKKKEDDRLVIVDILRGYSSTNTSQKPLDAIYTDFFYAVEETSENDQFWEKLSDIVDRTSTEIDAAHPKTKADRYFKSALTTLLHTLQFESPNKNNILESLSYISKQYCEINREQYRIKNTLQDIKRYLRIGGLLALNYGPLLAATVLITLSYHINRGNGIFVLLIYFVGIVMGTMLGYIADNRNEFFDVIALRPKGFLLAIMAFINIGMTTVTHAVCHYPHYDTYQAGDYFIVSRATGVARSFLQVGERKMSYWIDSRKSIDGEPYVFLSEEIIEAPSHAGFLAYPTGGVNMEVRYRIEPGALIGKKVIDKNQLEAHLLEPLRNTLARFTRLVSKKQQEPIRSPKEHISVQGTIDEVGVQLKNELERITRIKQGLDERKKAAVKDELTTYLKKEYGEKNGVKFVGVTTE